METLKEIFRWVADIPPEPGHIEFSPEVLLQSSGDGKQRKHHEQRRSKSKSPGHSDRKQHWKPEKWLTLQIVALSTFLNEVAAWVESEKSFWVKRKKPSMNHSVVNRRALYSRLILLVLQLIGRACIPEHVNDGFKTTGLDPENDTWVDNLVHYVFGGFGNWDGQYFLHVSKEGYTHENTMAFFPLFPLVTRLLATFPYFFLSSFISYHSVTLVAGWLINTWCFQAAAVALHDLVKPMDGGKDQLASMVVYFFLYNPASIFFSAFYSESMFAWLTFSCLLALYKQKVFRASYFAAFGAICRSNGLLNFGFIAAFVIGPIFTSDKRIHTYFRSCLRVFRSGCLCIIALFPFLIFQYFCIWKFCEHGGASDATTNPAFCEYAGMPYTYIQGSNWDVGFMKYFQIRQIPNFILAAPVLGVLGYESFLQFTRQSAVSKFNKDVGLPEMAFAIHGMFLAVFCFLFIHVQVSTRMIMSACPYLYLYIAKRIRLEMSLFRERRIYWMPYNMFVQVWFSFYFIVGTLAFTRGYPWT